MRFTMTLLKSVLTVDGGFVWCVGDDEVVDEMQHLKEIQ